MALCFLNSAVFDSASFGGHRVTTAAETPTCDRLDSYEAGALALIERTAAVCVIADFLFVNNKKSFMRGSCIQNLVICSHDVLLCTLYSALILVHFFPFLFNSAHLRCILYR